LWLAVPAGCPEDLEVIIPQWTHTHDLDVAVDLNWEIGLHAEYDIESAGILRIKLHAVDAADFWSPRIGHGRAGLEALRQIPHKLRR